MCLTIENIDAFCISTVGGAESLIYVANYSQIDTFTSTLNDKTINSITMKIDPLTTDPYFWYSFACIEGTVGYTENKAGETNTYAVQTVNFSIKGLSAAQKAKLEALTLSVLTFIIKDNSGEYHLLGKPSGLKCTVLDSGTGVAEDDLYGATITFSKPVAEWSYNMAIGSTIDVYDGVSAAVTVTLD